MKKVYLGLIIALSSLSGGGTEISAMETSAKEFEQFNAIWSDLASRYLGGDAITQTQLDTTLGYYAQVPINWDRVARFALANKNIIFKRAEFVLRQTNPTRAEVLNALAGLKIIQMAALARISLTDKMQTALFITELEKKLFTGSPEMA